MGKTILKCTKCAKYVLSELCECGGKAVTPKPPKYSPEDKYGEYRRKVKHSDLVDKNLV